MKIPAYLSAAWQYLFSILLIALTTLVFLALRDFLDTTLVALLYLIPIGVITTTSGFTPGIISALFSFFAFNYFFIKPYYTLAVHRPLDLVILTIFLVVSIVLSRFVGQAQAGLAAANAREHEATQLYELSTALAGLHDEYAVAQILGRQVSALLQCEYVEVNITGAQAVHFCLPQAQGVPPKRPPELTVPIQAARSTLGEILIWRVAPVISLGETRLIQTFASQAALALERARLAQAESRAKVLEESDRLKSAILSSVSHELRTPLSTIKAAASSLRGNEVSWDSHARVELIAAIDDESDHLNMLVGNLLDMSRIESGALKPRREWNILSEIVGSVTARMKYSAEEHKIEVDIPESLPFVPVDYVQMEQVFTNLISNSVKYAPASSLIRIYAVVAGDYVHVQVSNQGPQIPSEHLERIFDKFYRVNEADRVTGTGLGLSICKGIIEAHGGKIWAENLRDGLAFNFTLPLTWEGSPPPQLPMDTEVE
ncbi:two-component system, OmpR family, sensor histidine kinase KdpD [Anaerolineales bacterium]|nr:two-component system, OmpR family, sensor histidine kinase KdpD [Anaerolineales bacterium]